MYIKLKIFVLAAFFTSCSLFCFCQQSLDSTTLQLTATPTKITDSISKKIDNLGAAIFQNIQPKYVDRVNKKVSKLQRAIEQKTLRTLQRLQKQEKKLLKKLALKDSVASKALFAQNKYQHFADKIKKPPAAAKLKEYMPQFDSLKTSLAFLDKTKDLTGKLPAGYADKLKAVRTNMQGMEGKLQQANELKAYIKERKELLKTTLAKAGMLKDMKALNKEAYYYTAQINEYKATLKDHEKIERKALELLNKVPAFTDFMKKNSMLAGLFKMPDNYGTAESLAGLQTRASVQNMIQAKFSGSGVNPQQYIGQQMQQAQGELNKLKDKLNKAGNSNGDTDMPDFKPNNQKVKTFLKRIEYGANIQSQRPNQFLPVTTDFAATAGYKLNDKSTVGVGASCKLGWGNGFKDIHFSTQGIGLRSYVDVKLPSPVGKSQLLAGGFWISGGCEKNYQSGLTSAPQQRGGVSLQGRVAAITPWQTSGLIGLTKKYKIGKKTNSLQLLWDFLSYQQEPKTQPIVFRVGYFFN